MKKDQVLQVGDIYLRTCEKADPEPECRFRGCWSREGCLLHYLDLGPQVQSLNKLIKLTTTGKSPDPYSPIFNWKGISIKEERSLRCFLPINGYWCRSPKNLFHPKVHALPPNFLLAGRFVVLVAIFRNGIHFQKIKSAEERQRLKRRRKLWALNRKVPVWSLREQWRKEKKSLNWIRIFRIWLTNGNHLEVLVTAKPPTKFSASSIVLQPFSVIY